MIAEHCQERHSLILDTPPTTRPESITFNNNLLTSWQHPLASHDMSS
jgi:hypothetical protein